MAYKDFTQMSVWQKAFKLVIQVYKVSKNFPPEEKFGLISDIRRAANSVAHNISEGFGRYEARDKTRFYKISRGSSYELISQVLVSHALGYMNEEDADSLIESYKKAIDELDALIMSIENKN